MGLTKRHTHAHTQAYSPRQSHSYQKINCDRHTLTHTHGQICKHFHRVIIKRIRTFESRELESPAG